MPTTARLVSALFLAGLTYVVADMLMVAMLDEDPDRNFGNFLYLSLVVSALVGWFHLGKRVGNAYATAIGLGLTAVVAAVFWTIFSLSVSEMLSMSLDRRFEGPFDALMGAVDIGLGYGAELGRSSVLIVLLAGGICGGVLAEFVSRRWS